MNPNTRATLLCVALFLLAFAGHANDVFLYGVDEATFQWPEPPEAFIDAYAVYVSRNGAAEAFDQVVDEPEARIQGAPGDRIVARVRAVGRKTANGPLQLSDLSPPSPGIRFVAQNLWQTPATLALHCGTCAEIQWRTLSDPDSPSTLASLPAPWRMVAVGVVAGSGLGEVWQHEGTGEVIVLRSGATVDPEIARASGPHMVRFEALDLAELDGDATAELIMRDVFTGGISFWELRDGSLVAVGGSSIPASWQLAGVADLDGDGRSDIWLETETKGRIEIWRTDGRAFTKLLLRVDTGANGEAIAVADFDGDGSAEPLWRTPDGGLSITHLSRPVEGWQGSVERTVALASSPGDDRLEVRAVVPIDAHPGAEILVQDSTTSRVSLILPYFSDVPARVPLFDVARRFELVLAR